MRPVRSGRAVSHLFLAAALVFLTSVPSLAQNLSGGVFTLNQDRLFTQSLFGQRVQSEVKLRTAAIAKENRRMEAELKAEELALTEKRPDLEPAEFRKLADEFDAKVESIRTGQAQKSADFNNWAANQRKEFFDAAFPELLKLAEEISAVAILDQRSVIISSDRIDITDRAIKQIDAVIGDGSAPSEQ